MFERTKGFFSGVVELFRETKAEVYLVAAVGLIAATTISYKYETGRNNKLPLMFSEKSQLHKDAEAKGTSVGPMAEYLTSTNDACMKVFERWNRAMSEDFKGDRDKKLAKELQEVIDPNNQEHKYNLNDLLTRLPQEAAIALNTLSHYIDAGEKAKESDNYFNNSWSYYRQDFYDTVYETVTDEDGNTHTESHEEYSHSIHYYTYYPEQGAAANETLMGLLQTYPELSFQEYIPFPSKTNQEGELAMDKSIEKEKGQTFNKADFMKFATLWNTGSTLMQNVGTIAGNWQSLHGDSNIWNVSVTTAHSKSYLTYSMWDSGPQEYRDADSASDHLSGAYDSIDEIVKGILFVKTSAPQLHDKITKYIDVVTNERKGNAKTLRKEIIELTQEMYLKNFKEGADVDRFRWYMVFLSALLGLGAGALLGSFINYTGDKVLWQANFKIPSFRNSKQEPFQAITRPKRKADETLDKLLEEKPEEVPVQEQKQDDGFDFSEYNVKKKEETPKYESQDFPENNRENQIESRTEDKSKNKGWQPRIAVPKFQFRRNAEFKRTK